MNNFLPHILHPEDAWPAFLVVAGILTGLFVLGRVVLQGFPLQGPDRLPSKEYQRILIPILSDRESDYQAAVDLADRLASPSTGVLLVYLLPVPRSLPLDAELTLEQSKAEEDLEKIASLAQIARLRSTSHVRRCRSIWDELRRTVEEEKVDLSIFVSREDSAEMVTQWRTGLRCDLIVPGGAAAG